MSESIEIRKIKGINEVELCARFMADSEPWITLRRDYDASIKTLSDPSK